MRNDKLMPGQQWPTTPGVGVVSLAASPPHSFNCLVNTTEIDKWLLTILKNLDIIFVEHVFGIVHHERGRVF